MRRDGAGYSLSFLPRAKEGKPRADDRAVMDAILYVLTTGCRWIDIPTEYGDDSTANKRLRRWGKEGVWKRIIHLRQERAEEGPLHRGEILQLDQIVQEDRY